MNTWSGSRTRSQKLTNRYCAMASATYLGNRLLAHYARFFFSSEEAIENTFGAMVIVRLFITSSLLSKDRSEGRSTSLGARSAFEYYIRSRGGYLRRNIRNKRGLNQGHMGRFSR